MKNRKSGSRRLTVESGPPTPAFHLPAVVDDRDLWLHARSFHAAAKKLAGALEAAPGPFAEFDAAPVVFT